MKTLGQVAFEAYNESKGGLTYDGKPIPGWDALTDATGLAVRKAWEAAAEAVFALRSDRESEGFAEWAIVELMGHRKLAGMATEVERFGARMLRLDVPSSPPATQYYGKAALYCVTPTMEAIARAFAAQSAPAPVSRWDIERPPALPPARYPVSRAGPRGHRGRRPRGRRG